MPNVKLPSPPLEAVNRDEKLNMADDLKSTTAAGLVDRHVRHLVVLLRTLAASERLENLADKTAVTDAADALHALTQFQEQLHADIIRPDGRYGIHGHKAVDDDYFAALEYVAENLDLLLGIWKPNAELTRRSTAQKK